MGQGSREVNNSSSTDNRHATRLEYFAQASFPPLSPKHFVDQHPAALDCCRHGSASLSLSLSVTCVMHTKPLCSTGSSNIESMNNNRDRDERTNRRNKVDQMTAAMSFSTGCQRLHAQWPRTSTCLTHHHVDTDVLQKTVSTSP